MKLSNFNLSEVDAFRDDINTIINEFNKTHTVYPRKKNIHTLINEVAENWPDKVAVIQDDQCITYRILNQRSNQIANFILDLTKCAKKPVGILFENQLEAIINIIAILKAGCHYLPMEPQDPYDRIKYFMNDAGIQILLSEKKFMRTINKLQWECKSLDHAVCVNSRSYYHEPEDQSELMKKDLWDYIGEVANNEISGGAWASSYTGEDFSEEEMNEYALNISSKLNPLVNKKTSILEIGCGSGISLLKLAPLVKHYIGTDLSSKILAKTDLLLKEKGINNVHLANIPAHKISTLGNERTFDVAILNSVIQCFNGHNYLINVIKDIVKNLNDQAIIFCGDIQDLDSKNELIESLLEFKKNNWKTHYKTKLDWSNELFLSRPFWNHLMALVPEICRIEFSEKLGAIKNELTLFRYDVVLYIDKSRKNNSIKNVKFQHDLSNILRFSSQAPERMTSQNDLAYIIYTSGTTGKPKGCKVSHKNVIRLIKNNHFPFEFSPDDVWIKAHSYNFDFSVWEIFAALTNAATLVVMLQDDMKDLNQLAWLILRNKVSVLNQTPLSFRYLSDKICEMKNGKIAKFYIKYVFFGGDVLYISYITNWVKKFPLKKVKLINMYGITETTVHVTYHILKKSDLKNKNRCSIGKPLPDTQVFILDPQHNVLPFGVVGEIYVSGGGVCQGYLDRPNLTKLKFLKNPFEPDEKMYKTGDLGRWTQEGNIEYMGRSDSQLKIRGFRIESEEIENVIRQYDSINNAFVMGYAKSFEEEKSLIAYTEGKIHNKDDFKRFLSHKLPDYMIPIQVIELEEFPLTRNNKINVNALPPPVFVKQESVKLPKTETEKGIGDIWKTLLDLNTVSRDDNFFEIGGHSLKATQFLSKVKKYFNVDLPLKTVFKYPKLEELAQKIDQMNKESFLPIKEVESQSLHSLSFSQKGLWYDCQFEDRQHLYNMSGAFLIKGVLKEVILRDSFEELVKRHEILRTVFHIVDGEPKQRILQYEKQLFDFESIDFRDVDERQIMSDQLIKENLLTNFDLYQGSLLKLKLIRLEEKCYILLISTHHIVSDGWSVNIILNEIASLYESKKFGKPVKLASPLIQYKDYVLWEQQRLTGQNWEKLYKFWENYLLKDYQFIDFGKSKDKNIGLGQGSEIKIVLEVDNVRNINAFKNQYDVTLFSIFISLIGILLWKVTETKNFMLGFPNAGRMHPDLENTVGYFVNTLPINIKIEEQQSFEQFIESNKYQIINILQHAAFPNIHMKEIVKAMKDERSKIYNVGLSWQNFSKTESLNNFSGLDIEELPNDMHVAKSELWFYGSCIDDQINFSMIFDRSIQRKAWVYHIAENFEYILKKLLDEPKTRLKDIELMNRTEISSKSALVNFDLDLG